MKCPAELLKDMTILCVFAVAAWVSYYSGYSHGRESLTAAPKSGYQFNDVKAAFWEKR